MFPYTHVQVVNIWFCLKQMSAPKHPHASGETEPKGNYRSLSSFPMEFKENQSSSPVASESLFGRWKGDIKPAHLWKKKNTKDRAA